MTEKEDKEIIEKHLSGDGSAFSLIVKKYLKSVYNFTYSLLGDVEAASDVAQDTFIKAWRNIDRFDREKNLKTWLFTIAKNTSYDQLKKKRSLPFSFFETEDGENSLTDLSDTELLPDELLEKKDVSDRIGKALEKIPEKYGLILKLHYTEDFSLQEIAEISGLPYNTVKSRHNRALVKLRKVLSA